jgi:hypothetical protein
MTREEVMKRLQEYEDRLIDKQPSFRTKLVNFLITAVLFGFALHGAWTVGRNDGLDEPIRCKSPIDPELHIVQADGKLDTTWVYTRNNGFNVKVEPGVVYGIGN